MKQTSNATAGGLTRKPYTTPVFTDYGTVEQQTQISAGKGGIAPPGDGATVCS